MEYINEGGNSTATVRKTGENTKAQKIQIAKIGRQEFMKKSLELFRELNRLFEKKFKEKLWKNEDHLFSGFMFNGSTSFIMDPTISDEDIIKVKPSAGDFDIACPLEQKENLWHLLDSLEDKEIISGVTYKGNNKPTISSINDQINTVFIMDFPNGERSWAQIDFELLPFDGESPTEWAKFSHSSSFEDASIGVKAVMHKYLIRAIVGAASMRDDIVIVTPASTTEKYKLKTFKENDIPRMLKFSVITGIGLAYEPLLDREGNHFKIDNKFAYREINKEEKRYEKIVANMYALTFGDIEKHPDDVKRFNSFKGVIELVKKYLDKKQIDRTLERFTVLLWDEKMGQELEVGLPELDYEVKIAGYNYLIKELGLKMTSKVENMIEVYYKGYGKRRAIREATLKDYLISRGLL